MTPPTLKLPKREPRTKALEKQIEVDVRDALNREPGVRVTRNNTGKTAIPCASCLPKLCPRCAPRLVRPITYGLGMGGPDLVGLLTLRTPIGAIAIPFGVEVKQEGRYAKKGQRAWHAVAERRGMQVIVARSVDDALLGLASIRGMAIARLQAWASDAR